MNLQITNKLILSLSCKPTVIFLEKAEVYLVEIDRFLQLITVQSKIDFSLSNNHIFIRPSIDTPLNLSSLRGQGQGREGEG